MAYDNKQLKEWERARSISYMMYLANTTEKSPKSIRSFMPLPSDVEEDEEPKMTLDQLERTLSLYRVN